jgi:hypothetical protein
VTGSRDIPLSNPGVENVPRGGGFSTAEFDTRRPQSRSSASIRPVAEPGSYTATVHGWPGGSAGSERACRAGKVRPPSREIRTCGVPAIEGVTACQAASAAVRERPSGLPGLAVATPGVSRPGNVNPDRWPVSVATVDLSFDLFGIRAGRQPSTDLNGRCEVVGNGRASARPSASSGLYSSDLLEADNAQHPRRPAQ